MHARRTGADDARAVEFSGAAVVEIGVSAKNEERHSWSPVLGRGMESELGS